MKDITHYFSEPRKSIESTSTPENEVNLERAKIKPNIEIKEKPKRGRPKKKVVDKSDCESSVNVKNTVASMNKTSSPSSTSNNKKKSSSGCEDSPTTSKSPKTSRSNSKNEASLRKSKRNKVDYKNNNQCEKVSSNKLTNGVSSDQEFAESEKNNVDENVLKKKKQTEKLIEMADKKGYSKRKLEEEDEAEKIERKLEKRKKLFTIDTNKNGDITPKNGTPYGQKHSSSSLLKYFSKATPEQLQTERMMNSKVVVKAEIHTPNGTLRSVSVHNMPKEITTSDKKNKVDTKKILATCDEIQYVGSECISSLSGTTEQSKSPVPLKNKPRWSLKIKLQSSEEGTAFDKMDSSYSSKNQKENIKVSEKIPKILLPNNTHKDGSPRHRHKKEKSKNTNETESKIIDNERSKPHSGPRILPKVCGIELSDDDDDEIEVVKEYPAKRKSNDKLAPLFTKKAKPNPEFVAARKLFLQSDNTEIENKTQKSTITYKCPLLFPKISHVSQQEEVQVENKDEICFTMKCQNLYKPEINVNDFKTVSNEDKSVFSSNTVWESAKVDVEETLTEIESNCSDARTIWKFISSSTKCKRQKTTPKSTRSKRKSMEKKHHVKAEESSHDSLHCPWIHKYKPLSSREIVGNEEAALKLKNWLDGWKSSKVTNDDSSDEFYSSDCSLSSNNENKQIAVLLGPHGTGKTASVYAIAEELGYRVLEVNASSKRPGKKILKDFEEATQSHRVKKSNLKLALTSGMQNEEQPNKISQNSLILIEDIDLLFDEDEGFVSAVYQLASNTKRPIVMTCREVCPHLPKMAPHQLRIYFQPATGKRVSALLQLISLAETGCKLPHSCIEMLSQNGDLRKALLQLQFLLQSSKTHSLPSIPKSRVTLWNDLRPYVYKPALKTDKKRKNILTEKSSSYEKSSSSCTTVLENLTNSLNHVTLLSSLWDAEDPTSRLINFNLEPSLSLEEHIAPYSKSDVTSASIAEWLSNHILDERNLIDSKRHTQYASQLLAKKRNSSKVDLALSEVTSSTLDRRAMSVDYLPCIRTICRLEETRNQTNTKRGKRFFHYLQGTKMPSATLRSSSILTAACKVFQEDYEVNTNG